MGLGGVGWGGALVTATSWNKWRKIRALRKLPQQIDHHHRLNTRRKKGEVEVEGS